MGVIQLEGMEFFAYHGYYEEEQKIGNKYGVDVTIETDFDQATVTDKLNETVNYEVIYAIVRDEMAISSKLLEHIGGRILKRITSAYPRILACEVSIIKFNPPLGGVCRSATVKVKYTSGTNE